jgi:hypothetical protein
MRVPFSSLTTIIPAPLQMAQVARVRLAAQLS